MQNKALHIISFDNPFPPKYGGVIDVFYKIKALHSLGIKIDLHCFVDEIPQDIEPLENFVENLYFYKNKKGLASFFSFLPYSVSYRKDKQLLINIKKNPAPVFFESFKGSNFDYKGLAEKKMLRLHNIEHQYYFGLGKSESNLFKKILYYLEGLRYTWLEKQLQYFDEVVTLSVKENSYIESRFKKGHYIPLFHGNEILSKLSHFGEFAIYSGDLRTSDNRKAVSFLVKVFKEIKDYKLVIAVTEAFDFVQKEIGDSSNIELIKLQNYEHLKSLLAKAHINVMVSFQESGTKLKLINALYHSRHCLINKNMVDDPEILNLCTVSETKADFTNAIQNLRKKPYSDFETRKEKLDSVFNDCKNATELVNIIYKT